MDDALYGYFAGRVENGGDGGMGSWEICEEMVVVVPSRENDQPGAVAAAGGGVAFCHQDVHSNHSSPTLMNSRARLHLPLHFSFHSFVFYSLVQIKDLSWFPVKDTARNNRNSVFKSKGDKPSNKVVGMSLYGPSRPRIVTAIAVLESSTKSSISIPSFLLPTCQCTPRILRMRKYFVR